MYVCVCKRDTERRVERDRKMERKRAGDKHMKEFYLPGYNKNALLLRSISSYQMGKCHG